MRLLDPGRGLVPLVAAQPDAGPEHLSDVDQAMRWLTTERAVLQAAARQALVAGFDSHAWQLAWALDDFLERRGHWHDRAAVRSVALQAVRVAGDVGGQAITLNAVGWCHALRGDHERALGYCEQALTLLRELGDRSGQAGTWDSLGFAHHHLGTSSRPSPATSRPSS